MISYDLDDKQGTYGLGLLVEDRPRLTTVAPLLTVVPPLALRVERGLAGLVLAHLVLRVTAALLAFAVRATGLRDVHHCCYLCSF